MIQSTRDLINVLRREGELLEISDPIHPDLDLAEIQRRVVGKRGPALLFTNVIGTKFSVATNLYGSQKRVDLAFGGHPEILVRDAVAFAETAFPPNLKKIWSAKKFLKPALKLGTRQVSDAPIAQNISRGGGIKQLPQIRCWPEDGGAFVLLPLVYTQNPISQKPNLGMYRVQMFDDNRCGMHIQIHRGGGFHYFEAQKQNQALPAHVSIGGPPALTLAAVAPLPEDVPETLFASLAHGGKIRQIIRPDISPLPLFADADFCIVGKIPPHKRLPEGPFGDHYGYYSLQHDYPYLEVSHVLHRDNAIYPATVVGRPPQEDHFIACYLQEIFAPLIHLLMPQVRKVWAFEESGVHSLAGAVVKDRYPREALTTSLRILGEGQLSLTKVLLVTDAPVDAADFRALLTAVLERIDFNRDLFVLSNIAQDTLDYTGPKVNEGSKSIWLGLGDKKRDLPNEFLGTWTDSRIGKTRVFSPGALALSVSAYQASDQLGQAVSQQAAARGWSMIFLFDDADAACESAESFIWHAFTRFEPAADITANTMETRRFHVALTPPIVIDCRLKPWYPKVLTPEPNTLKNVAPILAKYGLD